MRVGRLKLSRTVILTAVVLAPLTLAAGHAASSDPSYTKTTLHFAENVGPGRTQPCDVIGDLYLPGDASPTHRVPAILTTNGFGGSKDDQAGLGVAFAERGYAVLSYSGLGFGGSGCKITLDDPDYDGAAASQLVSYLGGAPGIAYTDAAHTTPAPVLNDVIHDATDHAGKHDKYDPRVGMIGGSYGGEVQFAAASIDPRIDTIVPLITWNDLSYSLAPNNAGQTSTLATSTPGAVKLTWGLFFTADGIADGVANAQSDPSRLVGCPNFATFVCPALVSAATQGYFNPSDVAALQHASVSTYLPKITVPVLLMQGEDDSLFNLNEATRTYEALRAEGTPVKMIWQSWGHSDLTPAPGEIDLSNPNPATQYETARIVDWFNHYLKGSAVSTGPQFSYFRDWVTYNGIATPAYATSSTFPLPGSRKLFLSGAGALASSAAQASSGTQSFFTPPGGVPTSLAAPDAVGAYLPLPDSNLPGTYASWKSAALTTAVDVVGQPRLTVRVQAPLAAATQLQGPAGELVLFVKLYDVAPDGTASLIHGLVAPIRVANVNAPIHVTLPGIVHRFAPGHRIELMLAGGDVNYRGGLVPDMVSVAGGANQVLTLPTGS